MRIRISKLNKVIFFVVAGTLILFSTTKILAQTNQTNCKLSLKVDIIDSVIQLLKTNYVYPERVPKIEKSLLALQQTIASCNLSNKKIADTVTMLLKINGNDRHLRLIHSDSVILEEKGYNGYALLPVDLMEYAKETNFGFQQVSVIEGNIGYLKINAFFQSERTYKIIDALFAFLEDTNAIIIDLRKMQGGELKVWNYFISMFFEKDTPLLNITYLKKDSTARLTSLPRENNTRYIIKPIYVLTSNSTFSAGESIAYCLKVQNRASIIGEKTAGAANPTNLFKLNNHFALAIPVGVTKHPKTNSSWEAVGVEPDIETPAEKALEIAWNLAMKNKQILQTNP